MRRESKVAENFWLTRCEYPPVVYNFQRRYLDLGIILDYIDGVESILDLGCGEGQLLLMLRELTDIKDYYGYDLSKTFIENLRHRWGNNSGLTTQEGNFTTISDFPTTDMCVCMGAALYVLDDKIIKNTLSNLKSKIFILRVPCSMNDRVEIDKFSKEFDADYAAVYRTIPDYISILSDSFDIKSMDRCYPDSIESKYGTKQFFFVCKRR
jgi:SAM-dependent methyltransferase